MTISQICASLCGLCAAPSTPRRVGASGLYSPSASHLNCLQPPKTVKLHGTSALYSPPSERRSMDSLDAGGLPKLLVHVCTGDGALVFPITACLFSLVTLCMRIVAYGQGRPSRCPLIRFHSEHRPKSTQKCSNASGRPQDGILTPRPVLVALSHPEVSFFQRIPAPRQS